MWLERHLKLHIVTVTTGRRTATAAARPGHVALRLAAAASLLGPGVGPGPGLGSGSRPGPASPAQLFPVTVQSIPPASEVRRDRHCKVELESDSIRHRITECSCGTRASASGSPQCRRSESRNRDTVAPSHWQLLRAQTSGPLKSGPGSTSVTQ